MSGGPTKHAGCSLASPVVPSPPLLSPPPSHPNRFTWLLAPVPAGGGASNDPELLQALFNAAAGLCKALVKHITAALPAALKHTKGAEGAVLDTVLDLQALSYEFIAPCLFAPSVDESWRVKLLAYDHIQFLPMAAVCHLFGSADLRYHHEHHVRCLAAETFGFLLRAAPRKSLRTGMRALLAEHAGAHTPYCLTTLTQHRTQFNHRSRATIA